MFINNKSNNLYLNIGRCSNVEHYCGTLCIYTRVHKYIYIYVCIKVIFYIGILSTNAYIVSPMHTHFKCRV